MTRIVKVKGHNVILLGGANHVGCLPCTSWAIALELKGEPFLTSYVAYPPLQVGIVFIIFDRTLFLVHFLVRMRIENDMIL